MADMKTFCQGCIMPSVGYGYQQVSRTKKDAISLSACTAMSDYSKSFIENVVSTTASTVFKVPYPVPLDVTYASSVTDHSKSITEVVFQPASSADEDAQSVSFCFNSGQSNLNWSSIISEEFSDETKFKCIGQGLEAKVYRSTGSYSSLNCPLVFKVGTLPPDPKVAKCWNRNLRVKASLEVFQERLDRYDRAYCLGAGPTFFGGIVFQNTAATATVAVSAAATASTAVENKKTFIIVMGEVPGVTVKYAKDKQKLSNGLSILWSDELQNKLENLQKLLRDKHIREEGVLADDHDDNYMILDDRSIIAIDL